MKIGSLSHGLAAAGALALLSTGGALAQGPGQNAGAGFGQGGGRGFGGFRGQAFGMMQRGGPFAQNNDPGRSGIMALVMRPDVRTEIKTTSAQREKLDALQTQSRDTMVTTMRENFRQMRSQFQPPPGSNPGTPAPDVSPEDRAAARQQMRDQMTQKMTALQGDTEKQIEQILRPEQMERVRQLDLQWRGPLALADSTVADIAQITPEQRAIAAAALQEYRTAQQQIVRQAIQSAAGSNAPGLPPAINAGPGRTAGSAADPAAGTAAGAARTAPQAGQGNGRGFWRGLSTMTPAQTQMMQAQIEKDQTRARKVSEQKVLAVLTPEQTRQWQMMQGTRFSFRNNF